MNENHQRAIDLLLEPHSLETDPNGETILRVGSASGYFVHAPPAVRLVSLPTDAAKRNEYPMADGLLDYFPNALAEVSRLSKVGNEQHNPGQPMHHDRDKSRDHANKIIKHLVDRGRFDTDGVRHSAKAAWRALALLQEEIERDEKVPMARNARCNLPVEPSDIHPGADTGYVHLRD